MSDLRHINLDKAAEILRRELFEPLGLVVPQWSILTPIPSQLGWQSAIAYGVTEHSTNLIGEPFIAINFDTHNSPAEVAGTLAHEMIHAAIGGRDNGGHDAEFQRWAYKIGLRAPGAPYQWWTVPDVPFLEFYQQHLEGRV